MFSASEMCAHQFDSVVDGSQNFDVDADGFTVVDAYQNVAIAVADAVVNLRISCQTRLSKAVPCDRLSIERNAMTFAQQNMHCAMRRNIAGAMLVPTESVGGRTFIPGQQML